MNNLSKGLGIGAMVVAILAIFVPIGTIYVVWLALLLATIAAFLNDKVYPIVTILISIINLVFLSPATWAILKQKNLEGDSFYPYTTIILIIAPIIAMIISIIKNNRGRKS